MSKRKVVVGLSGGVDSGVAAALLVKQGYEVTGVHLHLWCENQNIRNKGYKVEAEEAARRTALQLGIPFRVFNLADFFKDKIVDYFLKSYGDGLTPNPCVRCNRLIKFGALYDRIRAMGYDFLATGHYCRIVAEVPKSRSKVPNKKVFHLLAGVDKNKDQSYFLYNLTQAQLGHLLFPLGELMKTEVRKMARELKLPVAERPESQEICFLAEKDYRPFLERNIAGRIIPGEVVDGQGKVIGRHRGLPLYTIGQRHGFELRSKIKNQRSKIIPPYYVVRKDIARNRLVVGFGAETEIKEFRIKNQNWINPEAELRIMNHELWVKIRHGGEILKIKDQKSNIKKKEVVILLEEAQRGISPGQSAVFYRKRQDWEVVGGGIIAV